MPRAALRTTWQCKSEVIRKGQALLCHVKAATILKKYPDVILADVTSGA